MRAHGEKSRVNVGISYPSSFHLGFLSITLCPAFLAFLAALLLLGERLDFVRIEEASLATPNPVLVAGVDVEDLLVEQVSGLCQDLSVAVCRTSVSARHVLHCHEQRLGMGELLRVSAHGQSEKTYCK